MTLSKKAYKDLAEAWAVVVELKQTEGLVKLNTRACQYSIYPHAGCLTVETIYGQNNKLLGVWSSSAFTLEAINQVGEQRIIKAIKTLSGV